MRETAAGDGQGCVSLARLAIAFEKTAEQMAGLGGQTQAKKEGSSLAERHGLMLSLPR
jgi:hypothetical protein